MNAEYEKARSWAEKVTKELNDLSNSSGVSNEAVAH